MITPDNVRSVWDNGGKTSDRYTIVLLGTLEGCLSLSDDPGHPQGHSQFGDVVEGPHLGKQILFGELPKRVQQHAIKRLAK